MSVIVLLVVVYICLYVVLSIPSIQNDIKERISSEVSSLIGGKLSIKTLTFRPFSEVILTNLTLDSPEGDECAKIEKVAAGIDLWSLFTDRKIILNYAEIIGLDAKIIQPAYQAPLNIQFLIDALSPKDKEKPSKNFNLRIRNVVVRESKARYLRPWMTDSIGLNHRLADIEINGLRVDMSIPVLNNDELRFDIRNIQFEASPFVYVRSLTADVAYIKDSLENGSDRLIVKDFNLSLPNSSLAIADTEIKLDSIGYLNAAIEGHITPSDFSELLPQLKLFDQVWNIKTTGKISDANKIKFTKLELDNGATNSSMSLIGQIGNVAKKDSIEIILETLKADFSAKFLSDALSLFPNLNEKGKNIIQSVGRVRLDLDGNLKYGDSAEVEGTVITDRGNIDLDVSASHLKTIRPNIKAKADINDLELDKILSTDKVGTVSLFLDADITGKDQNADGYVQMKSKQCSLMGNLFTDLQMDLNKQREEIELTLKALSDGLKTNIDGKAVLAQQGTQVDVCMNFSGLNTSRLGIKGNLGNCEISGQLNANTHGNNVDNLTGSLSIKDFIVSRADGKKLSLSELNVKLDSLKNDNRDNEMLYPRDLRIDCDWLNARIRGDLHPSTIEKEIKGMIGCVFPTLLNNGTGNNTSNESYNAFSYEINIKGESAPYIFFDLPIRPLTDIPIIGKIDTRQRKANLYINTPHLQQGKNKLIRDLSFNLELDAFLETAKINTGLIFPAKKGDAEIVADIYAIRDKVNVKLGINPTMESVVKGNICMAASFWRMPDPMNSKDDLCVRVDFIPSTVTVNDKNWMISESGINYSGKILSIDHFLISHEAQFVGIDGVASERSNDEVRVKLNDIDLEYIFNILNINYVSFGGMATGEVKGSRLLTKTPEASTKFLHVKGLSYNGAELGDGDIGSEYDSTSQKVGIFAVIRDPLTRQRKVSVDGGIWVTRDSLSFGFDANRVNVGIMKPFVSAFCSDLYGEASGKCKLFGSFSDIDLVGDLKADTISMKLDFTNTWYHAGNDSVFLHKGVIELPPITLYDDEGHTGEFSGWLRHDYFHNPVFNFRLRDAKSLLCYNTNEKINPLWYGTIYGSGHAQINGRPGLIDIDMNMTTEEGSKFYYVISDAEDVAQYSFLTFTDKKKERQQALTIDSVPEYLKKFSKQNEDTGSESSNVILSLKGTVTNDALVTLVMDPKAGDNITARGQGALQMDYNLANNDMRMIGTYVLDEGNYNFTLQDIIIKNFSIRKGSLIKFDGDPMNANLDIAATYRVNTNLTDLDKSFANDKELNRTNVPVDALLLVSGPMTHPDITFDIELPTLTSDVERKVKSLVSTNDMMSRQIIYLLALNRFYTPEYTGGQSNGSEWSSMASSTISSQLSNILSQMTDKLEVAPSFRSDKGDFTDLEFDVALSSRLLNNRLLINGNFGYRDRNTSNTQFVGDFDIEYLLNKNGNLRLKAYNHFNDQNYYLRSALTTQGVGVVFRRDFDSLFRHKKEDNVEERSNETQETQSEDIIGNRYQEAGNVTDSINN